jgi:F0F1-type ATP synthase beta subunit
MISDNVEFLPPIFKGGQSNIFGGSKGVGVTIESYGKIEISYINVDNF